MPIDERLNLGRLQAVAIVDGIAPTEFRIFAAGKWSTDQGDYVFDDDAARAVMLDWRKRGVDAMADYAHGATDPKPIDPALAGKAAAWFDIELRNGELWAVNVRWTPAAKLAIESREWRYISPTFLYSSKTRQIRTFENVALTNRPSTYDALPLVAASRNRLRFATLDLGAPMAVSPEIAKKLIEAIKAQDGDSALAIAEALLVEATGGVAEEPPAEEPVDVVEAATPPEEEEDDKEAAAAMSRIARLTGKTFGASAVREVETYRKAFLEQEAFRKERAVLEAAERRDLVSTMVKLGRESPATAWALDDKGVPDGKTPAEPWATTSLDALRKRVASMQEEGGDGAALGLRPPPTTPGKERSGDLTQAELDMCRRQAQAKGLDVEKHIERYRNTKAEIAARRRENPRASRGADR